MSTKKHFEEEQHWHEKDSQIHHKKFPAEQKDNTKKSERIRKGSEKLPEGEFEVKKEKEFQGLDAKQTLLKRKEMDLDHPHQLERHSATGFSAYDKKEKKGGGGAHNWGTTNLNEDFERPEFADVEERVAKDEREGIVGEKAVTFEEYVEKKGSGEIHRTENETKAKITEEELLKDIGKAVPLQSQKSKEIDDRKEVQPKKLNDDYRVGMRTEHADLLGFKTGAEEAPKDIQEKAEANPIKKVIHFFEEKLDVVGEKLGAVGEKLGFTHKTEAKEAKPGVNFQDEAAFPKLD